METEKEEKIVIFVWADGTWCEPSELHEYGHKSDDYSKIRCYAGDEEDAVMHFTRNR